MSWLRKLVAVVAAVAALVSPVVGTSNATHAHAPRTHTPHTHAPRVHTPHAHPVPARHVNVTDTRHVNVTDTPKHPSNHGKATAKHATSPCDDGMGRLPIRHGKFNDGSTMRRVWSVANDTATLPKDVAWVGTQMKRVLNSQKHLDTIFSWPRNAPAATNCTLAKVTYNKLCVTRDPKTPDRKTPLTPALVKSKPRRGFRTKVHLWTTCGDMHVRYRVTIDRLGRPAVILWGRSAS